LFISLVLRNWVIAQNDVEECETAKKTTENVSQRPKEMRNEKKSYKH
jgi:hypothetical protein